MKIGIFGGSFNPPHKMHEKIALQLIKDKLLDKVIFVPTGDCYKKEGLIPSIHRYNMLKILCDKNKNLEVSDFEQKNEQVFSYQTLDYFNNKYFSDEIYLILGEDNFEDLVNWKKYEYIAKNYKIIVIKRNGEYEKITSNKDIEFFGLITAQIPMENISSTNIRYLLKNNDKKVYDMVDKDILDYISENNLYI